MKNSVSFDLSQDGVPCCGTLSFRGGFVSAEIDGCEVFRRSVGDIFELRQKTDVGCGRLELAVRDTSVRPGEKPRALADAESIPVCRFTMTYVNDISEFCKMVNHYINTGEETEIVFTEQLRCETCGRAFVPGVDICVFCTDKGYVAKRTYALMRPYIPRVVLAGFSLLFSNLALALAPVLYGKLMDTYLSPPAGFVPDLPPAQGIALLALIMIAASIAGQVFTIFSKRISHKIGSSFSNDLRVMVYDKVQRLSLTSMSRKTAGDLIKRVTDDTQVVRKFLTDQGEYAISQTLMFLAIAGILFSISPLLTLIVFVPVPIAVYAISRFWHFMHLRFERQWVNNARARSILHDIVRGIRVVKTFGNEEREIQKFDNANKRLADISVKNEHTWAMVFPFLHFFVGMGEFFVIFIGGKMVLDGQMTAGNLYTFILFLAYIYAPLRWMSSLPRWLAELVTSLLKIFEISDEKQGVAESAEPVALDYSGDLSFCNVNFGYKSYEPVLKNVNLNIKQGEMIGLVGHSGAGKSTMINLIMRLYDPQSGCLRVGGTDIREADQSVLREHIGVVFQETVLFAGTVYDNIAYAKHKAQPEEIIAAAKTANAHEFIMRLPDGYNTMVGENGHTLSGGERQRIAIARAVLKDPKILILDEATSALDSETESKIQEAIGRLIQNRTTVAIAHRLATLRHADRLVVLEKGEIAEVGTHKELLEQQGLYFNLVMAQRQTSKLRSDDQKALEEA